MVEKIHIDKNELVELITDAIIQAQAERRKEDFTPQHICLLSEEERQAIKDLSKIFSKIEDAKWKIFLYVAITIAAVALTSFSLGFKTWCKSFLSGG